MRMMIEKLLQEIEEEMERVEKEERESGEAGQWKGMKKNVPAKKKIVGECMKILWYFIIKYEENGDNHHHHSSSSSSIEEDVSSGVWEERKEKVVGLIWKVAWRDRRVSFVVKEQMENFNELEGDCHLLTQMDVRKVIKMLIEMLAFPIVIGGNIKRIENAAGALWILSRNDENKKNIVEFGGIVSLISVLNLSNNDSNDNNDTVSSIDQAKINAAVVLQNMAAIEANSVAICANSGIIAVMKLFESDNLQLKRRAAGALRNIAFYDAIEKSKDAIVQNNGIQHLTDLLKISENGISQLEAKEEAAAALWNLASKSPPIKELIGNSGAIPALIDLLKLTGSSIDSRLTTCMETKFQVAGALRSLAMNAENKEIIVNADGIFHLIQLLKDTPPKDINLDDDDKDDDDGEDENGLKKMAEYKSKAAWALWELACKHNGHKIAIAQQGAIPFLVELLKNGNREGVKNAAGALHSLCWNENNRELIYEAGAIGVIIDLLKIQPPQLPPPSPQLPPSDATPVAVDEDEQELKEKEKEKEKVKEKEKEKQKEEAEELEEAKSNAAGILSFLALNNNIRKIEIRNLGGISLLIEMIKVGKDEGKKNAADTLKSLAVLESNASFIVENGGVIALIEMVKIANESDNSHSIAVCAIGVLQRLCINLHNRDVILDNGGIDALSGCLQKGNDESKAKAAGCLWNLLNDDANRQRISNHAQVSTIIVCLIDMLRNGDGNGNLEGKINAAGSLGNLSAVERNRDVIREKNGIMPLLEILEHGLGSNERNANGAFTLIELKSMITICLANLCFSPTNKEIIMVQKNGIQLILQFLKFINNLNGNNSNGNGNSNNKDAKKSIAGALARLSSNDRQVANSIIENGGVHELINVLKYFVNHRGELTNADRAVFERIKEDTIWTLLNVNQLIESTGELIIIEYGIPVIFAINDLNARTRTLLSLITMKEVRNVFKKLQENHSPLNVAVDVDDVKLKFLFGVASHLASTNESRNRWRRFDFSEEYTTSQHLEFVPCQSFLNCQLQLIKEEEEELALDSNDQIIGKLITFVKENDFSGFRKHVQANDVFLDRPIHISFSHIIRGKAETLTIGCTILYLAVRLNRYEFVKFLLFDNVESETSKKYVPLNVNWRPEFGYLSTFLLACLHGNVRMLALILSYGCDLNGGFKSPADKDYIIQMCKNFLDLQGIPIPGAFKDPYTHSIMNQSRNMSNLQLTDINFIHHHPSWKTVKSLDLSNNNIES